VTAPAWPAHPAWIAQLLVLLGTKIEHGVSDKTLAMAEAR
jgi:protease I